MVLDVLVDLVSTAIMAAEGWGTPEVEGVITELDMRSCRDG